MRLLAALSAAGTKVCLRRSGSTPCLNLTPEEMRLLRELAEKPRTISGTKSHAGLKRLVEAGYVEDQAAARGDTSVIRYELTDKGLRRAERDRHRLNPWRTKCQRKPPTLAKYQSLKG
jgi:DNA-binding PadR family transcriptional regulator